LVSRIKIALGLIGKKLPSLDSCKAVNILLKPDTCSLDMFANTQSFY